MDLLLSATLGIGLSMDCLAVSSCYGLQAPNNKRLMIELGAYFGIFQMGMILGGSLLGGVVATMIYNYAKWISSVILFGISIKMFIEGIKGEEVCYETDRLRIIYLAFATSIDSLLAGFAFSIIRESIIFTSLIVGIVCFIITIAGFLAGGLLHRLIGRLSQFAGALILLFIAIKSLLSS